MKKSLFITGMLVALSLLLIIVPGCSQQSPIEQAVTCSKVSPSGEPVTIADTFAPDVNNIFCSVKLNRTSVQSKVKAEWYVVNSDEAKIKNSVIGEGTVVAGTTYVVLQFTRSDKLLPRGDYEVKLYFDNELAKLVPFRVQGDATQSQATLSETTLCSSIDLLNNKPLDKINIFPNDVSKIFCSMKVDKADFNTVIRARWTYLGGEMESLKGKVIYEPSTRAEGMEYVSFSIGMPPGKQLPMGQYSITLFVESKEQASLPFSVVAPSALKWPYIIEMATFKLADGEPKTGVLTNQFETSAKQINFTARVYNAPPGAEMTIQWVLDRSADAIIQEKVLNEDTIRLEGTGPIGDSLVRKEDLFVAGSYLVNVSLNGEKIASVPFKVQ
jgi:hypothetical protein